MLQEWGSFCTNIIPIMESYSYNFQDDNQESFHSLTQKFVRTHHTAANLPQYHAMNATNINTYIKLQENSIWAQVYTEPLPSCNKESQRHAIQAIRIGSRTIYYLKSNSCVIIGLLHQKKDESCTMKCFPELTIFSNMAKFYQMWDGQASIKLQR